MQHCIIQEYKSKASKQTAETVERSQKAKNHPTAPNDPALADFEATIDLAFQDTDWLPLRPRPDLDSWDSGSLSLSSLVWCYCWCFVNNYFYWVIIDLDWICINKSWANSIVTSVDSWLFLGADVACRAGACTGKPVSLAHHKGWRLTYRKDCSMDTHKVRVLLGTLP